MEANEKKVEVFRFQRLESHEKAQEAAKRIKQLNDEIEKAKNNQQEKIKELEDAKNKAEMFEKRVEEITLQQSDEVKENDEKVNSLMEKLKNAEEELKRNVEKLQVGVVLSASTLYWYVCIRRGRVGGVTSTHPTPYFWE